MAMLRRYGTLLRQPHVLRMSVAAVLAGMPIGMAALTVLLFAREHTGSYSSAALVAAGLGIGGGFLAPLRGRAVDRRGAGRVLPLMGLLYAAAVGVLLAAGLADAPVPVLVVVSVAVGGLVPPVGPALRTIFIETLDPAELPVAISLQTLLNEFCFFFGPLIAGALVAFASPATALVALGVVVAVGAALFATTAPAQEHAGTPAPPGRLVALQHPGMRTLLLSLGAWGLTFGALEVAFVAFADEHGAAAAGGLCLAALSLGVALGTLAYGARRSDAPSGRRYVLACVLGVAGLAPLALAAESWQLAVLALVAGAACAAPTVAASLVMVDVTTPETRTEGTAWMGSLGAAGAGIGVAVGGAVVDAFDARAALITSSGIAFAGLLLVLVRQRTFAPRPPVTAEVM